MIPMLSIILTKSEPGPLIFFLLASTASNPALGHKQSKPSCRQTFLFLPLLFWQRLVLLCGFSHEWRVPRAAVRSQAVCGSGWQRGLRRSRPWEQGLQALGAGYMTHTCISKPSSLCSLSSLPQEVVGTCGEQCLQWLCNIKPQRWVLLPLWWHWQGRKFHGHFGCLGSVVADREAGAAGALWPSPCPGSHWCDLPEVPLAVLHRAQNILPRGASSGPCGMFRVMPAGTRVCPWPW